MALLGAFQRLLRGTLGLLRRGASRVLRGVGNTTHQLVVVLAKARRLLADRWDQDHAYRRTMLAAMAATVATVLPAPALAAALATAIAEAPGSRHRSRFVEADEDDWPRRDSRNWRENTEPLWTGYI